MNTTGLKIRTFPDPILRQKARPVKEITAQHRQWLEEMARLMYTHNGIGLAGPQVGLSESLIVVDIGDRLYKLINPVIVMRQGRQVMEEGCLSIPGVCIKIKRANKIRLTAKDETGKDILLDAEGLLACVFQHELDHLKGRLIIDYVSVWDRPRIKPVLNKLKESYKNEQLSQSKTKSCSLQL